MKCAFYEKEITPPLGSHIPGYFNERPGSDVIDRLYAKAVVFDNGDNTAAIITLDACFVPVGVREAIVKRVHEYIGLKEENILVAATHTHTGIPVPSYIDDLGGPLGYNEMMCSLAADCAVLAYKRLQESTAAYGMGEVKGISFVRDYLMKSTTPTTNPGRLNPDIDRPYTDIDPSLPVMFIKNTDGSPLGAIISFACHLDCVDAYKYSADFAGVLSRELKNKYGEDFVTVFLLGTAGNINHFDVTRASDAPDHFITMGKKIAKEALRVIEEDSNPVKSEALVSELEILKLKRAHIDPALLSKAEHIAATVKPIPGEKIAADNTSKEQYDLALSSILIGFSKTPEIVDVPIQVIKIGEVLIYAYPGEIFCEFGKEIFAKSPSKMSFVATLCNAPVGYVPVKEMFYETIYESKPGSNRLEKDAGYIMTEKLLDMAEKIVTKQ